MACIVSVVYAEENSTSDDTTYLILRYSKIVTREKATLVSWHLTTMERGTLYWQPVYRFFLISTAPTYLFQLSIRREGGIPRSIPREAVLSSNASCTYVSIPPRSVCRPSGPDREL